MIVVTVNTGSTSVKLGAYDLSDRGGHKRIAVEHSSEDTPGGARDERQRLGDFLARVRTTPDALAHRVVHGGTLFPQPTRIDESVLAEIRQLAALAPLHNPKALQWIEAAQAVCDPHTAQIAAFDTSFFATLPRVAAEYALPAYVAAELGVRRYGFHGLAHEAMLTRWKQLRPDLPAGGRLITLQLGGGCSITALREGQPVDTSMGFSPLEGLVMETRCGDVDPAIVPYLQQRLGKSGVPQSSVQIIEWLNHEGGLAGVSGGSTDFRTLLADPSPQSRFAVDLYCYRARKYIGAYLAVLGGCDGIVFGGGVGEHVPAVRARILAALEWAGIQLDPEANAAAVGTEARISAPGGKIGVHVVPVDEEQVLTCAAAKLLNSRNPKAP